MNHTPVFNVLNVLGQKTPPEASGAPRTEKAAKNIPKLVKIN